MISSQSLVRRIFYNLNLLFEINIIVSLLKYLDVAIYLLHPRSLQNHKKYLGHVLHPFNTVFARQFKFAIRIFLLVIFPFGMTKMQSLRRLK